MQQISRPSSFNASSRMVQQSFQLLQPYQQQQQQSYQQQQLLIAPTPQPPSSAPSTVASPTHSSHVRVVVRVRPLLSHELQYGLNGMRWNGMIKRTNGMGNIVSRSC